jgi:hypothetical protein
LSYNKVATGKEMGKSEATQAKRRCTPEGIKIISHGTPAFALCY